MWVLADRNIEALGKNFSFDIIHASMLFLLLLKKGGDYDYHRLDSAI